MTLNVGMQINQCTFYQMVYILKNPTKPMQAKVMPAGRMMRQSRGNGAVGNYHNNDVYLSTIDR